MFFPMTKRDGRASYGNIFRWLIDEGLQILFLCHPGSMLELKLGSCRQNFLHQQRPF